MILFMVEKEEALKFHIDAKGKIEVKSKVPLSKETLSLAYTPGVAFPCLEIAEDKSRVYEYTSKWNMVAVVSDGSAVLGLGNIGAEASLPVMEGKAILFKEFGGIDAFPICLKTQEVEEIVNIVKNLEPVFGGINLEDISAPRCFEVEERLKKEMNIPIFHDDQHGTAIVVLAGLINALKVVGKKKEEVKIVINGSGAAGIAVCKLLLSYGFENIILCDSRGAIYSGRGDLNKYKEELALVINKGKISGGLKECMIDSDVFIGVSKAGLVNEEMVKSMNKDAILFAMANPNPEIMPDLAKSAGARVVATGRSDFPNQVNNVLAFPGVFRGTLDAKAKEINEEMKLAAALAIAGCVSSPNEDKIIPGAFDKGVFESVSKAVYDKAKEMGICRE